MRLKHKITKDPAGFKSVELANARILAGLVNDFEELLLRVIEGKAGRALADNPSAPLVQLNPIREAADKIAQFMQGVPVFAAAQKFVDASMQHGEKWADKQLGAENHNALYSPFKVVRLPAEQAMVEMYQNQVATEIKGLLDYQNLQVQRAITDGFRNRETIQQITRRIQEVTPMAQSKAVTIARTETLKAGNDAAKARYEKAGIQQVQWIAAYDDRVCPICEGLHDEIFDLGEEPEIPAHPNCRCTLIPVIGDE